MAKKKQGTRKTCSPTQIPVNINPKELQHIIALAIIEAETIKKQQPEPPEKNQKSKLTPRLLWVIMFHKLKKLNPQNGATSLVQVIVTPICTVIKWIGYFAAAELFFYAIRAIRPAILPLSISQLITSILFILLAVLIWLIARLFGAASIEIEQTNSPDIIYNFASFLLALIAIIVSIVKP